MCLITRAGTLMCSRSVEGTEDKGGGEDRYQEMHLLLTTIEWLWKLN